MRPDLLSLLAGDGSLAVHQLRHLPEEELDEVPTDWLERCSRLMHAVSYSAHVAARRFDSIARKRKDQQP